MSKYIGASCKLCRREGEKLFLKGDRCNTTKCAIIKRNTPPGFRKVTTRARLTAYGQQLRAKQRVRRMYGVLEDQFYIFFERAVNQAGDTGENFLKLLEKRLDNVVYRAMFAKSRVTARQAVSHGHILINGKKVTIPSYIVKVGDVITIKERSAKSVLFSDLAAHVRKETIPGWLSVDGATLEIKVVSDADVKEYYEPLNIKLVIEYYSR